MLLAVEGARGFVLPRAYVLGPCSFRQIVDGPATDGRLVPCRSSACGCAFPVPTTMGVCDTPPNRRRLMAYVEPCNCESWRGTLVGGLAWAVRRNTRTATTCERRRLRVSNVRRRPVRRSSRRRIVTTSVDETTARTDASGHFQMRTKSPVFSDEFYTVSARAGDVTVTDKTMLKNGVNNLPRQVSFILSPPEPVIARFDQSRQRIFCRAYPQRHPPAKSRD